MLIRYYVAGCLARRGPAVVGLDLYDQAGLMQTQPTIGFSIASHLHMHQVCQVYQVYRVYRV